MEAACGNGYAPVRGSHAMMMMKLCAALECNLTPCAIVWQATATVHLWWDRRDDAGSNDAWQVMHAMTDDHHCSIHPLLTTHAQYKQLHMSVVVTVGLRERFVLSREPPLSASLSHIFRWWPMSLSKWGLILVGRHRMSCSIYNDGNALLFVPCLCVKR